MHKLVILPTVIFLHPTSISCSHKFTRNDCDYLTDNFASQRPRTLLITWPNCLSTTPNMCLSIFCAISVCMYERLQHRSPAHFARWVRRWAIHTSV